MVWIRANNTLTGDIIFTTSAFVDFYINIIEDAELTNTYEVLGTNRNGEEQRIAEFGTKEERDEFFNKIEKALYGEK